MNPHTNYAVLLTLIIQINLVWSQGKVEEEEPTADIKLKLAIENHRLELTRNISITKFLTGTQEDYSMSNNNITGIRRPEHLSSNDADTICDPGSSKYNCGTLEYLGCTGKKQFFHESTVQVNWFEAWEYCLSYGMYLAAIESRYEHMLLETFLEKPQTSLVATYWTSGNRFSGSFTWMATGKLITYVNWRTGEPNNRNGNEHCVEIVTMSNLDEFRWNDRVCNSLAYAMCQKNI